MTATGRSRHHDRELLDILDAHAFEAFNGAVWRVTAKGRDALWGSTVGGRWSPPGEFEVLYASLARDGALAEIGYRLLLEPVWPSRLEHELHHIAAQTHRTLRFADVGSLSVLGVDAKRYASFDYSITQAVAAAAFFLDFDGLIVPSARSANLNLVVFTEKLEAGVTFTVVTSEPVNWPAWRAKRPQPASRHAD